MIKRQGFQPSEHQIQAAFVQWCRLNEKNYPGLDLAFAVPNAAKRSMGLAMRMRREGLRAGVPDWWLPVRKCVDYGESLSGLVIEFKAAKGKLTDAQKDYIDKLENNEWVVKVCRSTEEAINIVKNYYGENP